MVLLSNSRSSCVLLVNGETMCSLEVLQGRKSNPLSTQYCAVCKTVTQCVKQSMRNFTEKSCLSFWIFTTVQQWYVDRQLGPLMLSQRESELAVENTQTRGATSVSGHYSLESAAVVLQQNH